tara:strand:+ start:4844 stop:5254 length:411 start_codon:yes stop_codon:yes gene_type:complete
MNSVKYDKWVSGLKEGELVLLMDSGLWSSPVIFLTFNGQSSNGTGYKSQHIFIPDWDHNRYHWTSDTQEGRKEAADKQWESTLNELEKHGATSRQFNVNFVNSNAEKRYFPFPSKFLSKKQVKFVKLINKIKGYEY